MPVASRDGRGGAVAQDRRHLRHQTVTQKTVSNDLEKLDHLGRLEDRCQALHQDVAVARLHHFFLFFIFVFFCSYFFF